MSIFLKGTMYFIFLTHYSKYFIFEFVIKLQSFYSKTHIVLSLELSFLLIGKLKEKKDLYFINKIYLNNFFHSYTRCKFLNIKLIWKVF